MSKNRMETFFDGVVAIIITIMVLELKVPQGADPAALRTKFRAIRERCVRDWCDREAVTLHPDTPEIEAIRLFCRRHTTLAVVERDTKKLSGIVSYWDAIAAITREG